MKMPKIELGQIENWQLFQTVGSKNQSWVKNVVNLFLTQWAMFC
jgi:hypothetical protein